jgi:hypothetical protein
MVSNPIMVFTKFVPVPIPTLKMVVQPFHDQNQLHIYTDIVDPRR